MSEENYDVAEAEAARIDEAIQMIEAEHTADQSGDDDQTPDPNATPDPKPDDETSDETPDPKPDDEVDTGDESTEEESEGEDEEKETAKELVAKLEKSWSMVDKREADLRQREQELKTQSQEVKEVSEFIKQFKANPYDYLEKMGITYEGWTDKILGSKDGASQSQVERTQKELLARIEANEKKQMSLEEQAKADANQAALNAYYEQIEEAAQGEAFELVRAQSATKEALQYAELWFAEHGEVLEPVKAVEAIENYLREELKATMQTAYAKKLLDPDASKKDKKKPSADDKTKKKPAGKSTETLTNQLGTSVSQKKNVAEHMTEEERIDAALKVFNSIE